MGPWPVVDTCGFQIAIEILRSSQTPGRNDSSYTQFDSVRKLRAACLMTYKSSPARCLNNLSFVSGKGQFSVMMNSKIQSKLFVKFMKGCEKRIGRLVKQDLGISSYSLHAYLFKGDSIAKEEGGNFYSEMFKG